ncbi:MAG: hypothetical protein Q7J36_13705, partial [Thiobacillus sp.]|nr:hypothetical protein [Thiobacillus sp.]
METLDSGTCALLGIRRNDRMWDSCPLHDVGKDILQIGFLQLHFEHTDTGAAQVGEQLLQLGLLGEIVAPAAVGAGLQAALPVSRRSCSI